MYMKSEDVTSIRGRDTIKHQRGMSKGEREKKAKKNFRDRLMLAESKLLVLKVMGEKILFNSKACSKIQIFLWM